MTGLGRESGPCHRYLYHPRSRSAARSPAHVHSRPRRRSADPRCRPPLTAQTRPSALTTTASVRLRYEGWKWFDPEASAPVGADNNDYGYGAVLAKGALRYDTRRWFDATAELQNSTLLGLPHDARGPAPIGEMGAGASHFFPHKKTTDTRVFLNQAFVTVKRPTHPTTFLRAGRFDYIDGTEATTADPTIEWIRRARIAGHLIANIGFSHVQRTYDGATAALWNDARPPDLILLGRLGA